MYSKAVENNDNLSVPWICQEVDLLPKYFHCTLIPSEMCAVTVLMETVAESGKRERSPVK